MSITQSWEHLKIPFEKIEVATEEFKTCIGSGGYGRVYKGVLSIDGKDITVAIKRLNEGFGQGLKEFLTEIQLLFGQEHSNIISLLGYCDEGKEKMLVYEYAARGSLDRYIRPYKSSVTLTWLERLKICADVARGLDHLHNHIGGHRMIIHRDIKSSNILIDENWVARISDFGLSKLGVTGLGMSDIVTNACGTNGYCDPDYRSSSILTKKSDVYSFGIVLFEVLCGRLCLIKYDDAFILSGTSVKEYNDSENLVAIIDPNLMEHIGSYSMTKFSKIAYRCLLNREQRPAMDIVVKELEETQVAHELEEKSKSHVAHELEEKSKSRVAHELEEKSKSYVRAFAMVTHELEEKRNHQVVKDSKSDEYWETKLPTDWKVLINKFKMPSYTCYYNKKKLVSHLREGLHFDQDQQATFLLLFILFIYNDENSPLDVEWYKIHKKAEIQKFGYVVFIGYNSKTDKLFFFINDDGKKCVTISARKFLDCKESLFQRSLRFLKLAGYPNHRDIRGTKCRIEVSMLSVGTMYAASLVFKYRRKRDEDLMPKKLVVTIKWTMEELSVCSTHYAELVSDNWYKIRMWHFMKHGLNATFQVVVEELSYFQKTDNSDLLIQGMVFEPVEMDEEEIDDVDDDDDEYWEKKLPVEFERYIEMSDMPFDCTTKKELYLNLCQGFLGCNGQMWFSLCKSTSGIRLILPATHIKRYDKDLETLSLSESRFKEVVRLETKKMYRFSCRLGSFMFSPHYTYACYLVFKYKGNQVPSNAANFYKAECNLDDNIMIQGSVYAHLTSVNIPAIFTNLSKSIQMPYRDDTDLEHSFVEKRNDGWMQVRLTKPLHQLENHESLEVKLRDPNSSSMWIIVEGVEFRPVAHYGSHVTAVRSANHNIIRTTHLHDDHDKNEENTDAYWEKKLPHEYERYIKMSDIPLNYTTKKELYFLFRHGFLANDGQLWFSACKSTRGICSILPSKHVLPEDSVSHLQETLYLAESRFTEVKKIRFNYNPYDFTCRLESYMLSPYHNNYAWYLVFKLEDGYDLSNDGFIFEAKYSLDDTYTTKLPISIDMSKYNYVDSKRRWVEKRDDGWLEARLTKPMLKHHLIRYMNVAFVVRLCKIEGKSLNGMIVEGLEFRPVVVYNGWITSSG